MSYCGAHLYNLAFSLIHKASYENVFKKGLDTTVVKIDGSNGSTGYECLFDKAVQLGKWKIANTYLVRATSFPQFPPLLHPPPLQLLPLGTTSSSSSLLFSNDFGNLHQLFTPNYQKTKLLHRQITKDDWCEACGKQETGLHALFSCVKAKKIWTFTPDIAWLG